MVVKDVALPDPVPLAPDTLRLNADFCASMLDANVEQHTVSITSYAQKDPHPEEVKLDEGE